MPSRRAVFRAPTGVRGFKNDDDFIIGQHDAGFFIVDVSDNWIDTFTERALWEAAVVKRTSLSPNSLSSPRAWHLQTRDPVMYAIYGGVFLVALPWVLGPLRVNRRTESLVTGNSAESDEPPA